MRPFRILLVLAIAAVPAPLTAQSNPSHSASAISNSQIFAGKRSKEVLAIQVLLDHSGHSPGVIDGVMGSNTRRAILAFQRANGMTADGQLSAALLEKLRGVYSGNLLQRYTVTAEDVAGPFVHIPDGMEEQSKLEALPYQSPAEGIAEKFHMAQSFLKALNPGVEFGSAGTEIIVVVPGKDKPKAEVARIEVDKASSGLRAFTADGVLLATYGAQTKS